MCGQERSGPEWAERDDALTREIHESAFTQYMEWVRERMAEVNAHAYWQAKAWRGTDALLVSWVPTVNCSEEPS